MRWESTAAVARVSVLPAGLALVAVLFRQPDLLVLAAPLALAALPLVRRPSGRPRPVLELGVDTVGEGAAVPAALSVADAGGAQTLALSLGTPDWVRPASGTAVATVTRPRDGAPVGASVALVARRWGHSAVGPGSVTLSACGGLLRAGPGEVPAQRVRVFPLAEPYAGDALVPRARGNVGVHRSLRAGEGSELAGVRPFAPGDRMRRINWRTSLRSGALRSGELQVNATTTERDADVVLLLDARFDAGTSDGVDGRASGIDIAVRATAVLADFYLSLGDRVGLMTYTGQARRLPARAGRGQRDRVLTGLLDTSAPRAGGGEPRLAAPAGLDPRALVLVVSPLVGRYVFEQAAALGRAGHTVVVVNTLPADAAPEDAGPWTVPVTRLWLLERATRIAQLRSFGVPVVSWRGRGSLDTVLQQLTRAASRGGASWGGGRR
ncbi:Uncharacterized conserved protein, DUF58 family, contains vWF domain [Modestobacter sp. DSM 44400]|uniref:DUF58 domain-containing protein n=1 Tax=Modestobacter sp. DSM 44400 TaxID=1550230 RepID=UPI00089626C8|nr:DUF58 domain-containing protein [Modestobacter sp. DSM 44400]SDX83003.1 Uncharacterized conserved protein, DUF58 family, contains vWF domain [Modestobacter sp. DSM 44400]